jgi:hypothetical protein
MFARAPAVDPRQQAHRVAALSGAGMEIIAATHEGLSLATPAGQALLEHDMQATLTDVRAKATEAHTIALKVEPVPPEHVVSMLLPLWQRKRPASRSFDHAAALKSFYRHLPQGDRTDWRDVKTSHVKAWVKTFEAEGIALNTGKTRLSKLRSMFDLAIAGDESSDIPRDNPCNVGKLSLLVNLHHKGSKQHKKETQPTLAEMHALWKTAQKPIFGKNRNQPWGDKLLKRHEHFKWVLRLSHFGFRPTEVTQIQAGDLEEYNGRVFVHVRAVDAVSGKVVFLGGDKRYPLKKIKTGDSSLRLVPLHKNIAADFKAFVARVTSKPSDFIFACFVYDKGKNVKRIAMWTPDRRPILTPRSPEVVSV